MKKILFLMIFSSLLAEEVKIYESKCIVNKNGRVVFSGNYALHNLIIHSSKNSCPAGYVDKNDIICDIQNLDIKKEKDFKRFKGECR